MAKAKETSEQLFAKMFNVANDEAAPSHEREAAERKIAAWLKRHGKTKRDIQAILVKAAADDLAANPPPPPSDPRDTAPHPFDDPKFTPAGLVEGILAKYVTMSPHVSVIMSLWTVATHIYPQFAIAPRIELVSEGAEMGKSTLRKAVKRLVYRPNREVFGTPAAIERYLAGGPCTIMLDEIHRVRSKEVRERLLTIWLFGHEREAELSFVEGGRTKYFDIYAPMLGVGIGKFLEPGSAEKTRTFTLEMEQYTEANKPPLDYNADLTPERIKEFDAVYSYLRNWAPRVELNPKPSMPAGVTGRSADNCRVLLAVADSCGPEWGRRAREAVVFLLEKGKAERPEVLILQHILVIMDTLELDAIPSRVVKRELLQLDLPEARWNRYRGPDGSQYAHALTPGERATLLRKKPSNIESKLIRPPGGGKAFRGYRREWIVEALRAHGAKAPAPHLRLVGPEAE
jgi:Protein of unknown function (DUF3631)